MSQATVVRGLLPYISKDPETDRQLLLKSKTLEPAKGKEAQRLIFRNLFINKDDVKITNIFWNYFQAVAQRWPTAWASTGKGAILARTNGFNALVRFLRPAYLNFTTSYELVSVDQFQSLFNTVALTDEDFTSTRFKPGSSGATDLFNTLCSQTGLWEEQLDLRFD